ncbi:hypothetical protein J2R96_006951 [Bradyrhizobium elkanii]|nr:hypothetical protein [Bradyrhizobium elkanii]
MVGHSRCSNEGFRWRLRVGADVRDGQKPTTTPRSTLVGFPPGCGHWGILRKVGSVHCPRSACFTKRLISFPPHNDQGILEKHRRFHTARATRRAHAVRAASLLCLKGGHPGFMSACVERDAIRLNGHSEVGGLPLARSAARRSRDRFNPTSSCSSRPSSRPRFAERVHQPVGLAKQRRRQHQIELFQRLNGLAEISANITLPTSAPAKFPADSGGAATTDSSGWSAIPS